MSPALMAKQNQQRGTRNQELATEVADCCLAKSRMSPALMAKQNQKRGTRNHELPTEAVACCLAGPYLLLLWHRLSPVASKRSHPPPPFGTNAALSKSTTTLTNSGAETPASAQCGHSTRSRAFEGNMAVCSTDSRATAAQCSGQCGTLAEDHTSAMMIKAVAF